MDILNDSFKRSAGKIHSVACIAGAGGASLWTENLLAGTVLGSAVALTSHFAGSHKIKYSGRIGVCFALALGVVSERNASLERMEQTSFHQPIIEQRISELPKPSQSAYSIL